ncbi:hypothetical protein UFOVP45_40 [uncultured Caudovirales phage]|uniref:Baseplate hub assembly protein, bacteriophage T4-like n=1 Tax=uncultured Caudovirales phage TaxID=2100421 RepID=A0A6J5KN93_9CAUD|nr:hypothetical protein UFOVP45_40 [uncultured Caudovirales phage]
MTTNTINAASNPTLTNDLVSKATAEPLQAVQPAEITPPSDTLVYLPGGYVTDAGEVIKTAEVRELTGKDEEAIAKNPAVGRAILTILNRAVVSIGNVRATEEVMDSLLAGDRDALLIGIYKATFGSTAEIESYCGDCAEMKTVEVDVDKDIVTKALVDPLESRRFTVKGKNHEFVVGLPTGSLQKNILTNPDKSGPELTTMLLESTVQEIDGQPVFSKVQIQSLGVADRRIIGAELNKRSFGPQLENITVSCPDCNGEVEVPINFGTLFRF